MDDAINFESFSKIIVKTTKTNITTKVAWLNGSNRSDCTVFNLWLEHLMLWMHYAIVVKAWIFIISLDTILYDIVLPWSELTRL